MQDEPDPASPEHRDLAALRDDLARLAGPVHPVPGSIDERVRRGIRDHFEAARRRRRRQWRLVPAMAAAAALLVVACVWYARLYHAGTVAPPALAAAGDRLPADVDGNGRVDVLDAFALARLVEAGTAPASGADGKHALDLNRDGAVDAGDVRLIAAHAVAVGGEAGS